MEEAEEIDKFCVSWVAINVTYPAVTRFVSSWNSHRIPGRSGGIPNVLARVSDQTPHLLPATVPSVDYATTLHRNAGGTLSVERSFGFNPIAMYPGLQMLRERDFRIAYPSMDAIFEDILHAHGSLFKQAVHSFVDLSHRYATFI